MVGKEMMAFREPVIVAVIIYSSGLLNVGKRNRNRVIQHTNMPPRMLSRHLILPTWDAMLSSTFGFNPQPESIKHDVERMHFGITEC